MRNGIFHKLPLSFLSGLWYFYGDEVRGGIRVKRIDRIYEYIRIRSQEWTEAAFEQANEGVTTQEVVMELDIKRPNASSDLNELVRQEN